MIKTYKEIEDKDYYFNMADPQSLKWSVRLLSSGYFRLSKSEKEAVALNNNLANIVV